MKTAVNVQGAPAAIGPYSHCQVIRLHGGQRLVFTSGQVGLDPKRGELVSEDVGAQTEQTLKNLATVLGGLGLTLADVAKTTVYLADMKDFQAMNEVYGRHFPSHPPARTTIAAAGLPKGARVEIECVATSSDL